MDYNELVHHVSQQKGDIKDVVCEKEPKKKIKNVKEMTTNFSSAIDMFKQLCPPFILSLEQTGNMEEHNVVDWENRSIKILDKKTKETKTMNDLAK